MDNIEIQKAKIENANLIYNNIKLCADDMAKQGLVHWIPYYELKKIEEDIIKKEVYLVKINNSVVGNFIVTYNENENVIYLGKLAIAPQYSGKGIGSKCLSYVEEYAKRKNAKSINLDVYEKSVSAIRFYKKNGYKIIGEKPTRRFIVKVMQKELR